jgi:hypothetical protein
LDIASPFLGDALGERESDLRVAPDSLLEAVVSGLSEAIGFSGQLDVLVEREIQETQRLMTARYLTEPWTQKGVYTFRTDEIDS